MIFDSVYDPYKGVVAYVRVMSGGIKKGDKVHLIHTKKEIEVMERDVDARHMNATARMMEAEANYGYKGAQTEEKLAKAQSHRVGTAMKPVEVENEIMKTNGQDVMNTTKE